MIARRTVALHLALQAALGLAPVAAVAQLDHSISRPGIGPGRREGVDEALRRTVSLVLRAEARSGGLTPELSDPQPLPEDMLDALVVGERLPDDFPVTAAPDNVNRRLPHVRRGSVWASAGTWMIEVDPVRMRILSVAPDVLPPEL